MNIIKFSRGVPPVESFPIRKLSDCACDALAKYGPDLLQYGGGAGFQPLCRYLAAQAGAADNQVVVGQGSLLLQDFLARLLIVPGDRVYLENPTYDRTILTFRRSGAAVEGVPVEADGLDVAWVETRLRKGDRPVLLYSIPDFQNPTGTVLSLPKRQRLVELAEQYGFWLVEDVPYRQLRYRGENLPSLFDLNPRRVIQMSSYSKQIGPGLRVGYVISPQPLAGRLESFLEEAYICPTFLVQAMVYEFIQRGWLDANLRELRALYPPRLEAMLSALDDCMTGLATWYRPEGGFFIGVRLQAAIRQADLLARANEAGLVLTDGRTFFTGAEGEGFVRLPFCSLTPEEIREGIERLAGVVSRLSMEAGERV